MWRKQGPYSLLEYPLAHPTLLEPGIQGCGKRNEVRVEEGYPDFHARRHAHFIRVIEIVIREEKARIQGRHLMQRESRQEVRRGPSSSAQGVEPVHFIPELPSSCQAFQPEGIEPEEIAGKPLPWARHQRGERPRDPPPPWPVARSRLVSDRIAFLTGCASSPEGPQYEGEVPSVAGKDITASTREEHLDAVPSGQLTDEQCVQGWVFACGSSR